MALQLGSLVVDLTARTTGFSKSMAGAMKDAERFAKEAKRASAEVASMSAVFAGMGLAALKMASSVDGPTKQAMGSLEKSTQLLAVQVADMLLPAVKEMTALFRQAAGVVAGLDPEVKKQISSFAVLAVQVAVAAKAFSMFSGLAANVFGLLKAGFGMVAAIGVGPLLNIVAAIGLVIGAVLLLHRAWRKNWGGIQEATKSVLQWFQDAFTQLGSFFGKVWDFIIDGAENFIESILSAIDVMQELTGKKLVDTGGLREGFSGLWKDLKNGTFVSEAFKFGKTIGEQLVDGIAEEWKALKNELGFDKLKMPSGNPIGLGRGMRPQGDISGMGFAADESLREIARKAAEEAADQAAVLAIREGGISHGGGNTARHGGAGDDHEINLAARAVAIDVRRAGKVMSDTLLQGTGDLGKAISNIAQAAAQGGPWAAVMAAIMEVFSRMKSFQKMMDTLSYGLERLGQFMEPLVGELFGIVETLTVIGTEMLKPVFDALKPLFDGITKFAQGLIPILSTVGVLFEAISPLIEFIGTVVGGILEALKPLLDLVGGVIKGIATVVLGIFIWFNEMAALFGDDKAKAESKRLQGIVDKMWAPAADELAVSQGEAARETWRNAAAQKDAADSAKKVAESLSNVPAGYRIANARYQADLGITAGHGYMGGGSSGGGGVTINGNVNVTSSATTIGGVAADAKKEAARERGQRTGNPTNRSGSGGRDG